MYGAKIPDENTLLVALAVQKISARLGEPFSKDRLQKQHLNIVIFKASQETSLKRRQFNFSKLYAQSFMKLIEQDLRILIEPLLHDMAIGYVAWVFYSIKHDAVVRNVELF